MEGNPKKPPAPPNKSKRNASVAPPRTCSLPTAENTDPPTVLQQHHKHEHQGPRHDGNSRDAAAATTTARGAFGASTGAPVYSPVASSPSRQVLASLGNAPFLPSSSSSNNNNGTTPSSSNETLVPPPPSTSPEHHHHGFTNAEEPSEKSPLPAVSTEKDANLLESPVVSSIVTVAHHQGSPIREDDDEPSEEQPPPPSPPAPPAAAVAFDPLQLSAPPQPLNEERHQDEKAFDGLLLLADAAALTERPATLHSPPLASTARDEPSSAKPPSESCAPSTIQQLQQTPQQQTSQGSSSSSSSRSRRTGHPFPSLATTTPESLHTQDDKTWQAAQEFWSSMTPQQEQQQQLEETPPSFESEQDEYTRMLRKFNQQLQEPEPESTAMASTTTSPTPSAATVPCLLEVNAKDDKKEEAVDAASPLSITATRMLRDDVQQGQEPEPESTSMASTTTSPTPSASTVPCLLEASAKEDDEEEDDVDAASPLSITDPFDRSLWTAATEAEVPLPTNEAIPALQGGSPIADSSSSSNNNNSSSSSNRAGQGYEPASSSSPGISYLLRAPLVETPASFLSASSPTSPGDFELLRQALLTTPPSPDAAPRATLNASGGTEGNNVPREALEANESEASDDDDDNNNRHVLLRESSRLSASSNTCGGGAANYLSIFVDERHAHYDRRRALFLRRQQVDTTFGPFPGIDSSSFSSSSSAGTAGTPVAPTTAPGAGFAGRGNDLAANPSGGATPDNEENPLPVDPPGIAPRRSGDTASLLPQENTRSEIDVEATSVNHEQGQDQEAASRNNGYDDDTASFLQDVHAEDDGKTPTPSAEDSATVVHQADSDDVQSKSASSDGGNDDDDDDDASAAFHDSGDTAASHGEEPSPSTVDRTSRPAVEVDSPLYANEDDGDDTFDEDEDVENPSNAKESTDEEDCDEDGDNVAAESDKNVGHPSNARESTDEEDVDEVGAFDFDEDDNADIDQGSVSNDGDEGSRGAKPKAKRPAESEATYVAKLICVQVPEGRRGEPDGLTFQRMADKREYDMAEVFHGCGSFMHVVTHVKPGSTGHAAGLQDGDWLLVPGLISKNVKDPNLRLDTSSVPVATAGLGQGDKKRLKRLLKRLRMDDKKLYFHLTSEHGLDEWRNDFNQCDKKFVARLIPECNRKMIPELNRKMHRRAETQRTTFPAATAASPGETPTPSSSRATQQTGLLVTICPKPSGDQDEQVENQTPRTKMNAACQRRKAVLDEDGSVAKTQSSGRTEQSDDQDEQVENQPAQSSTSPSVLQIATRRNSPAEGNRASVDDNDDLAAFIDSKIEEEDEDDDGDRLPVGEVVFGPDNVSPLDDAKPAPAAGMQHEAVQSSPEENGTTRATRDSLSTGSMTVLNRFNSAASDARDDAVDDSASDAATGENGGSVDDDVSGAGEDVTSDGENVDSVASSTKISDNSEMLGVHTEDLDDNKNQALSVHHDLEDVSLLSGFSFGSKGSYLTHVNGVSLLQQGSDDVSVPPLGNDIADPGSSTAPGAGMLYEPIQSSGGGGATRGSSFSSTGSSTTSKAEDSMPSAGENGGSVDDNASDAGDIDSDDSSTKIFDDSPPPNEKDDLAPGSLEAASSLTAEHPPSPSEESVSLLQQDGESQDNKRSSCGESGSSPASSKESEGSDASPSPKQKNGTDVIDLTSLSDESSGNSAAPSPSEESSVNHGSDTSTGQSVLSSHENDELCVGQSSATKWKFLRIIGHEGPLKPYHSNYKGSMWNVLLEWETGDVTAEPLKIVGEDDPFSCAIYARDNNLLDLDGWKQFKKQFKRIPVAPHSSEGE